jgi:hypothetical protein
MIDLFILYTMVCYLFHLGLLTSKWGDLGIKGKTGGIFSLIISPISIPFTIGYLFKE